MSSSSSSFFIPSQPVPGGGFDLGSFGFGSFASGNSGGPVDFTLTSFINTGHRGCPPCCPDDPPGTVSGSGGVRAFNGMVVLTAGAALTTNGFKYPFGTEISYNNFAATVSKGFGKGWIPSSGLAGLTMNAGEVLYHESPTSVKVFAPISTSGTTTTYQAGYFVLDRLVKSDSVYTLTSPDGSVKVFNSAGRLTSFLNPGGNTGTVTYDPPITGPLKSVSLTDGTDYWTFTYAWNVAGYIESVIFSVNGTDVRKSKYTYDDGRLRTILNYAWIGGSWGTDAQITEGVRFTYHSTGLLRHVITPTGYQQMINNGIPDPGSLTVPDTTFNDYAETEYKYKDDGSGWVDIMYTHGRKYNYEFVYTSQSQASTSLNVWTARTDITQPDGSLLTYYFNRGGQVILKQVTDAASNVWYEYAQQFEEGTGRLLVKADADAISSVNPGTPALVTLKVSAGLIEVTAYNVNGYLDYTGVRQGTSGTLSKRVQIQYTNPPSTSYGIIYVPSSITEYRATGSAVAVTATYNYTWHSGTLQMSKRVTTLPVIATGENGTGTAAPPRTENFDLSGYPTSTVDERGTVTAYTWSKVRDSLIEKVQDQGTGKLELKTTYTVDDLGRTVLELGPVHPIAIGVASTPVRRAQWTYYKDREGEVMTFGGYQKTTGTNPDQIVGPVTIVRPNDTPPPTGYAGYRTAHRIDAAYTSTGIPVPSTTFTQTSWVRWTVELYDNYDRKMKEWKYFVIPGPPTPPQRYNYGTKSNNYGEKLYGYDGAGRLDQTTCAGGTIDKTTFNAMGWIEKEELGTDAGLTVTRTNEYYPNGTLKKVTLPVDGDSNNDRVTDKKYDFRQRLTENKTKVVLEGVDTTIFTTYAYDNRNLPITVNGYHTSPTTGNSTSSQTQDYDALGRRYRRITYPVDGSGNIITTRSLRDDWFYDKDGQIARQALAGNTLNTVIKYNAVGWATFIYKTTGAYSTSDPTALTNATVIEQTENVWDDGGNLTTSISKARFDNATGNGELKDPNTEPKSRNGYVAYYPDGLGRTQGVADYGTNQGVPLTRQDTIPPRSTATLVTSTAYSTAGNVSTVTDPTGVITAYTWDKADRLTILIENQSSGSSSSSASTDTRTTRYEYTDDGWLKKLKSDNAATGQQITEWVYGVSKTAGPSNPLPSKVNSNRLVRKKIYPDAASGPGSSSSSGTPEDAVLFAYNVQRQVINMNDQTGTAHTYTYDALGRRLSDAVSAFGSGIDTGIYKLEQGFNARGLRVRATSYSTGSNKANEVRWEYNEFNKPVTEYQEHNGAVIIGSSRNIDYLYADGSANTVRKESMTMVSGTVQKWLFSAGLSNSLSRPDAVQEGTTSIATYRYLGLSNAVGVSYPGPAVALTYQHGGSGDAGDQYTGLDRFGRPSDLRWNKSSTALVSSKYGYYADSNQSWRRDVAAAAAGALTEDQMFQYDKLQQLYQRQRGTLTPSGGPPYTGITSIQQTEAFGFDETGNWLSDDNSFGTSLSQSRTHNKSNEIISITGPTGVVQPVYNAAGNMTTVPQPGNWTASHTLKWDAWNRLMRFPSGGTATATYAYDALNRRVSILTGGSTNDYYYTDLWQVSEVYVGTTNTVRCFWGVRDINDIIKRDAAGFGGTLYALRDILNIVAVTNSSGTVQQRFAYDAFGSARFLTASWGSGSNTNTWTFLLHGCEFDPHSGFYCIRFRYYHSGLGRWLSRDPIAELGGLNLYQFTKNNAVNFYDLLGLHDTRPWPEGYPSPDRQEEADRAPTPPSFPPYPDGVKAKDSPCCPRELARANDLERACIERANDVADQKQEDEDKRYEKNIADIAKKADDFTKTMKEQGPSSPRESPRATALWKINSVNAGGAMQGMSNNSEGVQHLLIIEQIESQRIDAIDSCKRNNHCRPKPQGVQLPGILRLDK